MIKKNLMALALTCIAATAHAEKAVVLLYNDARGISDNVKLLSNENLQFHKNPVSNEIIEFLVTNKIALSEDIQHSKHVYVKSKQEFCTSADKGSDSVLLSIPTCNKKYGYDEEFGGGMFILEALEKARVDLIRASVQHLGISDRKEADAIAKAAIRAIGPKLTTNPLPEPSDVIYTVNAAAWCSFGNGSGNVGPWFGSSTSTDKGLAYSSSTLEAVTKCQSSDAEKALCRCEVNYTTIHTQKK